MNLESRKSFFEKILNYYLEKSNGGNDFREEIEELSDFLSKYFFKQYEIFRKDYPKSIKRYSEFKVSDLENPLIHDVIISFAKEKIERDYFKFCCLIFGFSKEEFAIYEKKRRNFSNMW